MKSEELRIDQFREILLKIARPLEIEMKQGCRDSVAVGGLKNYVQNWIEKARKLPINLRQKQDLRKLSDPFADYDSLTPIDRLQAIETAKKQIRSILNQNQDQDQDREPQTEDLSLFADVTETITESKIENEVEKIEIDFPEITINLDSIEILKTPLKFAEGIGTRNATRLFAELGLRTVNDLLSNYPRDYLDRRKMKAIGDVGRIGENETVTGKVVRHTDVRTRKIGGKNFTKITIYDSTGIAQLFGFGKRAGYLKMSLPIGTSVVVSGKFQRRNSEIRSSRFEFEPIESDEAELIHTGRIVPKYPLTANLTQRAIRKWSKSVIDNYIDHYPEFLSIPLRKSYQLMDRKTAIREIHFPTSPKHLSAARRRLAFDEFFLLEIFLEMKKIRFETEQKGIEFSKNGDLIKRFLDLLPFELTNAQKKVIDEMRADMQCPKPMNRLLQGDVGSGKTVVAAIALLTAIENGYQGAVMVPTEVLADQHAINLSELFAQIDLNVVLLKGDLKKSEREKAITEISDGTADVTIGTHALIQEGVNFHKLGVAIIDEQHRFGVRQRATLHSKGQTPDLLVMTATPIPRTLSLTVYGDLNVSIIDELPPDRKPIKTKWIKTKDSKKIYAEVKKTIGKGRQAYIVYPLVEESENFEDLRAATEMAEHFQTEIFPDLKIGLLHGRMRSA